MTTRARLLTLLAVSAAVLAGLSGFAAARSDFQAQARGEWKRHEGYAVMVETGPLGSRATSRELVVFYRIYNGRIATPDLLVISLNAATGATNAAYRLEMRDGSRQPASIEPLAVKLDANKVAIRIQSEGAPIVCHPHPTHAGASGAAPPAFIILRVPTTSGTLTLPYWEPAFDGAEPANGAAGVFINIANGPEDSRALRQSARRAESGDWMVDLRSDDSGAPIVGNAQFSSASPLPIWGQMIDIARQEHVHFRQVAHAPAITRALSIGRGRVAGDPLLVNPELLFDAESVWYTGVADLVAQEVITQIAAERRLRMIEPRNSPSLGEVVPFGYELFAVNSGVATGSSTKKVSNNKSAASPRGAVGLIFAGRFEAPDTRIRYEAWLVPGSDERAEEGDPPNPVGESTGRMLLRLVLGNAASGLISDRSFYIRRDPGWYETARSRKNAAPGNAKKMPAVRRGSDAILLRRENDLAPVELIFYKLSDDLRAPVQFARADLDGTGSASVVRRSLLERAKDFFIAGGFSAFTTKKGSSFLLTRAGDEGTQVDRIADRGCTLDLLDERDLPEEPWKLEFNIQNGKNNLWGSAIPLAVGRNRYGDARMPRDGIVRRTDGEELVSYEAWEVDRPWWSEAVAAYPKQGVGVRFRPLIHARLPDPDGDNDSSNDEDILPFEPPPPPPQPQGNPKTPRVPPAKPNPKPKPKPEPAPPPVPPLPGTPKTGG